MPAHRATDVITHDSNIFNCRRFDGHLCDTSLVDTLLVVNPCLRHVTRRHVIRHQLIVRDATTASTLRYGPSNHRQCQVDRFSIAWYRIVRHAVARTTTTTGSMTVSDSSTLPSIPSQQQDIAYITGARHRTASARLSPRRPSMRRTHQRPPSPMISTFVSRIISFDFDFLFFFIFNLSLVVDF